MTGEVPFILVSNRGPATFQEGEASEEAAAS